MAAKCKSASRCKFDTKQKKGECQGMFKFMLSSLRLKEGETLESPNVPIDSNSVGSCFTELLVNAESCSNEVKAEQAQMLDGINVPSEDEIKKAREEFKADKKKRRGNAGGKKR